MWARGLDAPSEVTLGAAAGLRSLTLSLIETRRSRSLPDVTEHGIAERFLPKALLANLGPLTRLQELALPFFPELVDLRRSMIAAAPPGVGKTRLGQMGATYATLDPRTGKRRESGTKALVLMPTRALIDEQLEAWEKWLDVPGAEPPLRVVGVSAEHDLHRRDVTAGEYEVAICVYESAANLLAGPQRSRLLDEIALIVVDEWQWMRDLQRGGRLDALLTGLQVNEGNPPPVMLMGPELDQRTHDAAVKWLSASRSIMPPERITSLTVHVSGDSKEIVRTETPEGEAGTVIEREIVPPITETLTTLSAGMKQQLGHLPSKGLSVLLATRLLLEDDTRRIIIFLEERGLAVRYATAAIDLLEAAGLGSAPAGGNPWTSGRFPSTLEVDPEARYRELRAAASVTEDYDRAQWWLLNGVGVHTASIERQLQQLFIREFDTGIARLLFATDTVAEGINVAASHVIVSSTFRGRSGEEELVPVHRVRQRLNRAGRKGRWGDHGHGYLCVAPRAPATILDQAVVTNPERAFSYFVANDRGLAIVPGGTVGPERIDRLAAVALHHLRHHDVIRSRDGTLADIKAFLERTYLAAYTATPIGDDDAVEVLDRLKSQLALEDLGAETQLPAVVLELLVREGAVADDGADRLRVTPLGHVIDENAFPLRSARTVRSLRDMLNRADPPSDLDLICQAATDNTARGDIGWAFTRNRDVETTLVRNLQDVLRTYAETGPGAAVDVLQHRLACGGGLGRPRVEPHESLFLLASGQELVAGGALANLLDSPAHLVADADPGAARHSDLGGHLLLRTLLAYEWANFEKRSATNARLKAHVFGPVQTQHVVAVTWRVEGPHLRNFVRACAHLLGAAHALLPRHARLAESLAGRLRRGLPPRLTSLDMANLPFAGREHLAPFAHGHLSMTEILDQLCLDQDTRRRADHWLRDRAIRLRAKRSALGAAYATEQLIPEGPGTHGLTGEGLLHRLELGDLPSLARVLAPFGASVDGHTVTIPGTDPAKDLRIQILDASALSAGTAQDFLEDPPSLVVARGELPDAVIHADERYVITPAELIRGLIRTGADQSSEADPREFGLQVYRYFDRE